MLEGPANAVWFVRGPMSAEEWREHMADIDRVRDWSSRSATLATSRSAFPV